MNYAKDQTKDTTYVSVNALIQSKKKGRGYLPAYAQFQKEQKLSDTPPEEEVESKTVVAPEKAPAENPEEHSVANGGPVQGAPVSEIEASPGSASEGSVPEAAGQIEPSGDLGLSKDKGFELDETDVPKGEEKESKPEEKQVIQKKGMTAGSGEGNGDSNSDPGAEQFKALSGNGEPLPGRVQAKMEPALGMDLQNVRIHRDGQAGVISEDLGARAFTSGQDIYFNQGEYNPDTTTGDHLIAHELTHVKQQQTIPGLQYQLQVPAERDHYEREADATADKAVNDPRQPETKVNVSSGLNLKGGDSVQLAAKPESKAETPKEKDSNWILEKIGALVRNLPGYDLLALVIGRDPLSGQAVKGDAVAVVKAVMGFIPGGALLFENLEKARIISKAIAWFKEEFQKMNLSFVAIKNMFTQAWQGIFGAPSAQKPKDEGFWGGLVKGAKRVVNAAGNAVKALLSPEETFNKIKSIFLAPITRIKNFVSKAGPKLMDFIFEGAMTLAGSAGKKIMGILNKGKGVLQKIISDPIGFLTNLIDAVRGGLGNFVAHIGTHLQKGLGDWILGTLGNAGIILPEKLNLTGIFNLMAQILGVTWRAIRAQVVKGLGPTAEKVMAQVEKGIAFVGDFITKGPIALMDMAEEFLGELRALFFDTFITWLRNTVIGKAVEKLISMFNPVGAIIQAIITIYNMIQFFIERAKQIAAFVNSVFNSIAEIAGGNLAKAVAAVENSLAKALPVAIGFLANLVGIGGIAAKIKEIIQKIRGPIDKVVGKVVGFIVGKAKELIGKVKETGKTVVEGVKEKVSSFTEWWKVRKGFTSIDGEKHALFFEGEGKNATLIVQSKPIAIAEFLKKARDRKNPKDIKYVDNAEKIFSRIKILQEELPDKIIGKRLNNDVSNKEKQEEGFSELKQLLLDLAETLSYIQINDENKEFPPVIYPPFVNNVKAAEETKVAFLNKINGFAKGSTAGAHSGKLLGWDKIEEYELTNGRGGTFVKMHLIPECLGGYATDSNLTPGEAKLNSTLRDHVEQPAKEAIGGKQDLIWYEVHLTYNKDEEYQDFISSIKVQWGYYVTNKGGKWEKDTKVQKEVNQSVSPPVFKVETININQETDSKKVRNALKISRTKAELIIEERIENGIFKKVDDIFDRVEGLSSEQRNSINNSYVKRYFYF